MNKLVVCPQVIVYKNAFKSSTRLMSLLEEDHPDSLFSRWRKWYSQGYRKEIEFALSDFNPISRYQEEELSLILEIVATFNSTFSDYFSMYNGENGIWPEYIKDWESIINFKNNYNIDYFKYCVEMTKHMGNYLMMDYHVDEFLIEGELKKRRHVVTSNIYLNNDYNGGEICVYDSKALKSYMYKPGPGDIVIMPSTIPFYHGVMAYEKADRYFLRTFVDYTIEDDFIDGYDWEKAKAIEDEFIKNHLQTIRVNSVAKVVE